MAIDYIYHEYLIYNLKIPIVFGACREVKCYLESGLIYYLKIYWAFDCIVYIVWYIVLNHIVSVQFNEHFWSI